MNQHFRYPGCAVVCHFLSRTFLKELENCCEKPELVGICFLKRVRGIWLYTLAYTAKSWENRVALECFFWRGWALVSFPRRKSCRSMRSTARTSRAPKPSGDSVETAFSSRSHSVLFSPFSCLYTCLFSYLSCLSVVSLFLFPCYLILKLHACVWMINIEKTFP